MKAKLIFIICLLPLVVGAQKVTQFDIQKGINISAWLSQTSVNSGPAREAYFTQKDLNQLAKLGFDHIRIPVSEYQMYTKDGLRNEETFKLIHNVIEWCKQANMRVIFDCHQTYDHDFSKYSSIVLFSDMKSHDRFLTLWTKLSDELKKYPNELVAYEILNEPNAKDNKSWNIISSKILKLLRKLEPNRVLILGSNKANKPYTFPDLEIPSGDPNIILSFHFYYPYLITHNQASFMKSISTIKVPLNYPGQLVADSVINRLEGDAKATVEKNNGVFDRAKLLELMQPAIDIAKKKGLRLHCGEFGSNFKYEDRSLQLRWMEDMVSIFKEYKIPFSVWGYRKEFGVFNDAKQIKDDKYLQALLK